MEKGMYKAAMEGNIEFLREIRDQEIETGRWSKQFLGALTPQGNNIIHIASQYDKFDFLEKGFNLFNFPPFMVAKANANGDTPLHVASKRGNKEIVELLVGACKKSVFGEIDIVNECKGENIEAGGGEEQWPWRAKNVEGNTPLHEALIYCKIEVAKYLVEVDPLLACFVNKNKETPLHLAIKYNVDGDKKLAIETIELMNKRRACLTYKGSCLADEESLQIISLLLQKSNNAAVDGSLLPVYVTDNDGLTPLLRAANQSYFNGIKIILDEYPDCLEMCDPNGKTILHLIKFQSYQEVKVFFKNCPQICCLMDQQDNMGNTPTHIAVMNCIQRISEEQKAVFRDHVIGVLRDNKQDNVGNTEALPIVVMNCVKNITNEQKLSTDLDIDVIRALLEFSSTNFAIRNKQGLSVAALLKQFKSHFSDDGAPLKIDVKMEEMLIENKFKQKEEEKTFWKAVENADVNLLAGQEMGNLEKFLKDGTLNPVDLLHILLQRHCKNDECSCYKVEELMKKLFENNPLLLYETNSHGDTPLHVLARIQDHHISESLLHKIKQSYDTIQHKVYCSPWKVKNTEGNTPLHEALMHIAPENNGSVIRFLIGEGDSDALCKFDCGTAIECHLDVAAYLNNQSETPLHVFCRSKAKFTNAEMIKKIIIANKWATFNRDIDGLTPLLRAATEGKIDIVLQIWDISPESAQLRDGKGQTFWHMMDLTKAEPAEEDNLRQKSLDHENKSIKELSTVMDDAGITPLFRAIKSHNYNLAEVISTINKTKIYDVIKKESTPFDDMVYQFTIVSYANRFPRMFERILWDKMKNIGEKSIYGIPKSEINSHVNTIGVIAVLLATIAFTGAFTVPGGFDQNKGHPLLLEHCKSTFIVRTAYCVFMVADILTMCLSMMVLFCLQWIITGSEKDRYVIMDLSIMLLNSSFVTTMVALIMGVFATTFPVSPNLAIFTIIMGSLVLLLLQRWFLMSILQYIFLTYYLVQEMIWSLIPCTKWCDDLEHKKSKSFERVSR